MIPEPQHAIPARFQFSCSSIVGLFLFEMVSAVDLDDQFRIETHEVHDIPSDRQLAAKLVSGAAAVAQVAPEFSFGFGLVAAQRPCKRFQGSLQFSWSVRQIVRRVQYPLTLALSRRERELHIQQQAYLGSVRQIVRRVQYPLTLALVNEAPFTRERGTHTCSKEIKRAAFAALV